MSTYLTLGGKSLSELPAIPTNLSSGDNVVGGIELTWTNNNTITGTTNIAQYWNGSTWIDAVTVASSATTATISGLTDETSYNFRVAVYVTGTTRYYPSLTKSFITGAAPFPLNGLIGRWQFEDDLTNSYSTGGGETLGTNSSGVIAYTTGIIGKSLTAGAPDNYYYITFNAGDTNLNAAVSGTHVFTYSVWLKTDKTKNMTFGLYDGDTSRKCAVIYDDDFDYWKFTDRGGSNHTLTDATGDWEHFAVVFDGTDTKLYRNNSVVVTETESDDIGTVGMYIYVRDVCQVDQLYVYDRALSASEVSKLYNSGAGI